MIPEEPTMTIPLRTDADGVIRIGHTRVLLELVIHAYYLGETPEGIVETYPSLTASQVYAVIGYYLENQELVDAYVRQRHATFDQTLRQMAADMTPESRRFRSRLQTYKAHKRDDSGDSVSG